jgi:RepB DNA-primase from phage plasmid
MASMAPPRKKAAPGPRRVPGVAAVRCRDGRLREVSLTPEGQALLLVRLLFAKKSGFVEVVGASRGADGRLERFARADPRNFIPADDREGIVERIRAQGKGRRREVFFTPATLRARTAGNASVAQAETAWVDIDDPRNLARLRRFLHRPHAVVHSGSGGVHAYWQLTEPVDGDSIEEINRKLAAAVGADPASCNRGRILRVPGTRNYKRARPGSAGNWCRVQFCDLSGAAVSPATLTAGLKDPKAPRPARRSPQPSRGAGEPWVGMPAPDYYRVITGLEPPRDGRVSCPNANHEDLHPSAQLYEGPDSGWFCFSCGAGGRAPDLVAALRGWPTGSALRDDRFRECIEELRTLFGAEGAGSA